AADGIRAFRVTGVQTCALPISPGERRKTKDARQIGAVGGLIDRGRPNATLRGCQAPRRRARCGGGQGLRLAQRLASFVLRRGGRSEERRGGEAWGAGRRADQSV